MTNEDLTRLYNEANGIPEGKAPPITTERIFTAMREAIRRELEACARLLEDNEADACADAIRARTAS